MKNIPFILTISVISSVFNGFIGTCAAQADRLAEAMRQSLVYLEVATVGWEQIQPWRQTDIQTVGLYASAVSANQVITVAQPLANAASIQARRFGQNEFVPAKIRVVDYEVNLCLLELDESRLQAPLAPLLFEDNYQKNKELRSFWMSSASQIITGRATLDRADVRQAGGSFSRALHYILSQPSRATANGELYCFDEKPVGIAAWCSETEAALIPAETIHRFLQAAQAQPYNGFGAVGFEYQQLLDPAVRRWLKMPAGLSSGVYVSSVYKIGSGSSELQSGDVILSIGGKTVNAFGRVDDERYDKLDIEYLITSLPAGQRLTFEIFRDGKTETIPVAIESIRSQQMLTPYHHFDRRVPYVVIAGYVFMPLSRDYLRIWGDNWLGKAPPHLVNYLRRQAFNPTDQRKDIVILSYVLPDEVNLGYQQLGRLVVESVNGKPVKSFNEFVQAITEPSFLPYHTIEFELSSPTLVISKQGLDEINRRIQQKYGIRQALYIEN